MQIEATLNLHDGFGQCGNALSVITSMFPAGERFIRIEVPYDVYSVRINSRCNSSDDFMQIIMAIDALRREGVTNIELFLPYFPYSRQDRVCQKGEAFSLKAVCQILHNTGISRILTYDLHSDVALCLLDNVANYNNHREVIDFVDYLGVTGPIALIAPDQGATKKVDALMKAYPDRFYTVVHCQKTRHESGFIGYAPIHNNIRDMTALVVDDLCDGGATFLSLADELRKCKVRQSYLFVSHGIFSKGHDELITNYRHIGTTNSIRDGGGIGVKVFPLNY